MARSEMSSRLHMHIGCDSYLLSHQAVGLGAPQTIIRCHRGHYKALSRCLLVGSCVLAKISFRRPTAPFARLTQSQAISQSIAFSSHQINERYEQVSLFFIFRNSFIYNYCFLYHGDQRISWWRICRWRAVNFEIHLRSSGA